MGDHDTDAVLDWVDDGQPTDWRPDAGAVEAALQRGLIVHARGGGYAFTEDGELELQVLV